MIFDNTIKSEINKLLIYLQDSNNKEFIPDNIENNSIKIHHSRDSSIIICCFIYLVNINKLNINDIITILLNFISIEYKLYLKSFKNIPITSCNENGIPIIEENNINNLEYDIIAYRIIAFCNILELLQKNNLYHLIEDILINKKFIEIYLNLLINFCTNDSYNLWKSECCIHYCNIKLYIIALNKAWYILQNYNTTLQAITYMETIETLNILLQKFNKKCIISGNMIDVIIPTLLKDKVEIVNKCSLNASIFIPYLPIFNYSNEFKQNVVLHNTALIIFNMHYKNSNYTQCIKDNIYITIPLISNQNDIKNLKNIDKFCVLSTISTYNIIINFDTFMKKKTLMNNWDYTIEYNPFIKKVINKFEDVYNQLKNCMSNKIDIKSNKTISNEYSNVVRMVSGCFIYDIKKNHENNNSYSELFNSRFSDTMLSLSNKSSAREDVLTSFDKLKFNFLTSNDDDTKLITEKGDLGDLNDKDVKNKIDCNKNTFCKCKIIQDNINLEKHKIKTPDEVSIEIIMSIAEEYYCFECNNKKDVDLDEPLKTINMERIVKIYKPLQKLIKLRGLEGIKDVLLDNIIYFLINDKKNELLHMCIMGPPGVGKTVIANIIAEIYKNLGILSKGHIVKVSRPDLIGKYLGHTATKTADAIKKAEGGILFIDEAYSLVDRNGRDSFSKECIDTLTQYLTEKCSDMLCIIAGYKTDIEEYFFNSNKGLERRFAFKFNIEGYDYKELYGIFCDKMKNEGWIVNLDNDKKQEEKYLNFFKEKHDLFTNFGGDIENLVYRYNLVWNRINFFKKDRNKNISFEITKTSIEHLFNKKNSDSDKSWKHMYM